MTTNLLALILSVGAQVSEGERLSYALGCVRCHHQTPRVVQKSPALTSVRRYSLEQFQSLLRDGVTVRGRDLAADGRIMGVVATEQYSYLTEQEIEAVYNFLKSDWTRERSTLEEAKIPALYKGSQ